MLVFTIDCGIHGHSMHLCEEARGWDRRGSLCLVSYGLYVETLSPLCMSLLETGSPSYLHVCLKTHNIILLLFFCFRHVCRKQTYNWPIRCLLSAPDGAKKCICHQHKLFGGWWLTKDVILPLVLCLLLTGKEHWLTWQSQHSFVGFIKADMAWLLITLG